MSITLLISVIPSVFLSLFCNAKAEKPNSSTQQRKLSHLLLSFSAKMGFPVGYSELLLPRLLLHSLSLLGYLRKFISTLFLYLGLPDFLEPDIPWPDTDDTDASISASSCPSPRRIPVSALLIRELLPVVKFSDLVDPPDSCAVCLYDFEEQDEIRQLANCRHIFHRSCLDRWMIYDQKTCPLCRTSFVPDDMQETFNERLWAASGIPEFFGDYAQITAL